MARREPLARHHPHDFERAYWEPKKRTKDLLHDGGTWEAAEPENSRGRILHAEQDEFLTRVTFLVKDGRACMQVFSSTGTFVEFSTSGTSVPIQDLARI